MARMQINYPTPERPSSPGAPAGANSYQPMPTKHQQSKLFGLFPMGPGRDVPIYNNADPAVRALYGLDQPAGGAPASTPGSAPAAGTPAHYATPISAYGVNDTGRTTPFNPNPSFALNTTNGSASAPAYPAGSGAPGQSGGTSAPTNPLAALFSLFGFGRQQQQQPQYEAALRERPDDVQRLVSMTRRPTGGQNAGGFLGGLFDDKT